MSAPADVSSVTICVQVGGPSSESDHSSSGSTPLCALDATVDQHPPAHGIVDRPEGRPRPGNRPRGWISDQVATVAQAQLPEVVQEVPGPVLVVAAEDDHPLALGIVERPVALAALGRCATRSQL